jgi:hypothetical protein
MTVNIEKMRHDMKLANRNFNLGLWAAAVATIGALVTIYHLSDRPTSVQLALTPEQIHALTPEQLKAIVETAGPNGVSHNQR